MGRMECRYVCAWDRVDGCVSVCVSVEAEHAYQNGTRRACVVLVDGCDGMTGKDNMVSVPTIRVGKAIRETQSMTTNSFTNTRKNKRHASLFRSSFLCPPSLAYIQSAKTYC